MEEPLPPGDEIELDEEDERILAEVWATPLDLLRERRYSEHDDPLGLGTTVHCEAVAAIREMRSAELKGR